MKIKLVLMFTGSFLELFSSHSENIVQLNYYDNKAVSVLRLDTQCYHCPMTEDSFSAVTCYIAGMSFIMDSDFSVGTYTQQQLQSEEIKQKGWQSLKNSFLKYQQTPMSTEAQLNSRDSNTLSRLLQALIR